ncbi:MAG: LptA/OstA family protein [Endomicrobiales bacterium]
MKKCFIRLIIFSLPAVVCVLHTFSMVAVPEKEPKTIITGDQMEIESQGQMVIFTGNAKVVRGKNVLIADRIVQDKKINRVDAFGNVDFKTFTQQHEPVWGVAQKAWYSPAAGTGELVDGPASITYSAKTSTSPLKMIASRIAFDERKEEINAVGNVEILSSSACAYGPNALLYQKTKSILMTKTTVQPELVYTDPTQPGRYKADKITAYIEQKHVFLEGNVAGKVRMNDKEK